MITRTIQSLVIGVGVWGVATTLLVILGDALVPSAGTMPVPLFVIVGALVTFIAAWQLSLQFQRTHDDSLTTRLLFAVCVAAIGLLLDGIFVAAFGAKYPLLDQSRQGVLDQSRQGVLAVGLYVAYAALIAGSLLPRRS